jgi:DNA mismatch repair protein MutL
MTINLLPEEIVNQIAAGEVIENPSAVVKELVENSIDANSTQIDIEIEDSGLKKIIIKDNGLGMSKEDILKSPKRHATSKIKSFSDLYNIKTMGFRGEALASIFSVANAKIISKHKDLEKAYELTSKDPKNLKESGLAQGTSITVENLFYNTPARKKYLRSNNIEFRSILDIIYRYTIYYHNIKFTLKHNSKTIINKPIFKTKLDNISYILGSDLKDKLLYFEEEKKGLKISGFIGNPAQITYPYVKNQYLYVNSRFVKSKLIKDAIYVGFSTNLMTQRHPFFVLFIEIDPEIIDVNVHPTKIEIRFENEL